MPLIGHNGEVFGIKSLGSNTIVSAGRDGIVAVWSLDTGRRIHAYTHHHSLRALSVREGLCLRGHCVRFVLTFLQVRFAQVLTITL